MKTYIHNTFGTCSQVLKFDLEDGRVYNFEFLGGCNGNLQAIGRLIEGRKAEDVIASLRGVTCGGKPTSCGDQLAIGLENALSGKLQPEE